MYVRPVPLVDPPIDLSPEQRLACAVLHQAVLDARHHPIKNWRPLVRGWLTSTTNRECRWWCAVAGLNYESFVQHVRAALARPHF